MKFSTTRFGIGPLIAALGITLLAGCASLEEMANAVNVQEPQVSLAGTKLSALSFEGAELTMLLNVENPNVLPIKLAGFDYALAMDGKSITSGKQTSGVDIAARGANQVEFPIAFKFADVLDVVQGLANKDQLAFNINSNVRIDLPVLGERTVPVSYSNQLPIPKAPSVTVSNVAIENLSLTGAALNVEMDVDNPNAFGVDLTTLDYNLLVNGKSWLETKATNVATLPEKGSTKMSVPIRLSFADMGMALYQTLTQTKPMEYQLNGNMTLDTTLPLLKNVQLPFNQLGSFQAR